jgi:hypothetical protein
MVSLDASLHFDHNAVELKPSHINSYLKHNDYWVSEQSLGLKQTLLLTSTGAWLSDLSTLSKSSISSKSSKSSRASTASTTASIASTASTASTPSTASTTASTASTALTSSTLAPLLSTLSSKLLTLPSTSCVKKWSNNGNQESLFTIELVLDQQESGTIINNFVLTDVIAIEGKVLADVPFSERQNACHNYYNAKDSILKRLPLFITCKQYYPLTNIKHIFNNIRVSSVVGKYEFVDKKLKQQHFNLGLTFTPNLRNLGQSVFFWTWPKLRTVFFKVVFPFFNSQNQLNLHAHGLCNTSVLITSTDLTKSDHEHFFARQLETKQDEETMSPSHLQPFVVECAYNSNQGMWNIKEYHDDVNLTDSLSTVVTKLVSLVDNITKEELVHYFSKT